MAMTTEAPLYRWNRGTAPADFSLPTDCLVPWKSFGTAVAGVTCVGGNYGIDGSADSSCFPRGYSNNAASTYHLFDNTVSMFSPATTCPSGLTSAGKLTRPAHDPAPTTRPAATAGQTEQLQFLLSEGETAVKCMPSGYSDAMDQVRLCTSSATPGETVTWWKDGIGCMETTFSTKVPLTEKLDYDPTYDGIRGATMEAVWIVHNPTSTGPTDPGFTSYSMDDIQLRAQKANSSVALFVGTAIGIVALLCTLAVGTIMLIRQRRNAKLAKGCNRWEKARQNAVMANDPTWGPNVTKPELEGSPGHVLSTKAGMVEHGKPELDADTVRSVDSHQRRKNLEQYGYPVADQGLSGQIKSPYLNTVHGSTVRYELAADNR